LLQPSAEMKAERSGAFISADGCGNSFNFRHNLVMVNNFSIGRWGRLRQKQQDVQLGNGLQSGLNFSSFKAQAILNCIDVVYPPFFDNTARMNPGHILFEVVSVGKPAKEKFSGCWMKSVRLTLNSTDDDLTVQEGEEVTALIRDIKALKDKGIYLYFRFAIKELGRSVLHCEKIVGRWLSGMVFAKISRQTSHSIEAIANCVAKFKQVICLVKDNHKISTIFFKVKISVNLAQQHKVQKTGNRFNNFNTLWL